jgi:hemerythrin-like domain-containing protein
MHKMKITEALLAEHTIFLGVFDHIERALPSLATLTEVGGMATLVEKLLESHAQTETDLAYLALDHVLEHNGELERMHHEHHEIDDRLRKVHTAKTCAEARRFLKSAIVTSREHFRGEERSVFPLLEKSLQPETLTELGESWLRRQAPRASPA